MATYSNTNGNPSANGHLKVNGGSFDLPSSIAFGGTIPKMQEDCERWTEWIRYYRKLATESDWTFVGMGTRTGSWNPTISACGSSVSGLGLPQNIFKSATGWDTHRFAVAVKLRSSGQEASVKIEPGAN